jgi:histidinol-phosphatase (PHP family)
VRINYHLHNRYSSDGRGNTDEVCRRALELSFDQICLTNHAERMGDGDEWILDLVEARERFEELQHEIERLQPEYPDLRILLGIEVEYRPEWVETLDALVDSVDFDLVIGSVHVVDGAQISGGPGVAGYFEGRPIRQAYGRYFEVVEEMVDWGGFDVVGHFDLVKRYGAKHYGPHDPAPFEPPVRRILRKMAEKGLGLEVNTSGVVQPPGEPYPGLDILRLAREAHIATVTIGTDSHVPTSFDQGWEVGDALLRQAGFTEITLFSHRIRKNVPLEPPKPEEA